MKKLILLLSFSILLSASNTKKPIFYFFHSEFCPHCVQAEPFIESLEKKYPEIKFEKLEISSNSNNLTLFKEKVKAFEIDAAGVPFFVFGKSYVMGYRKETHDKKIISMIEKELPLKVLKSPPK